MNKPKILFIDRDGTIIVEPPDNFQVDSLEKLAFLPEVLYYLRKITQELDYQLVMVTNQDGLGTESFPEKDFWLVQNKMLQILNAEGIDFREICIDKSFPHEELSTRKPQVGMVQHYLAHKENYAWQHCFVVGDRLTDMQLAQNMDLQGILISDSQEQNDLPIALKTTKWAEIYTFLKQQHSPRQAHIHRKTHETEIRLFLDLDSAAPACIHTGIGFLDHMLEQVAKHAHLHLRLEAQGDLHIEPHHTIEDVAIALGQAFSFALQDKRGIARYGHCSLPMDEALAQIALDFSGRGFLVWKGSFKRETIGIFPTEMVVHFFQSFAENARCTLHCSFYGTNDHHQVEAIFKAFAKALQQAVKQIHTDLPSTKGIL